MVDTQKEILLKHLSIKLKELWKDKDVTQQDILDDTSILISGIEQGERDISIYNLFRLCIYFKISMTIFLIILIVKSFYID